MVAVQELRDEAYWIEDIYDPSIYEDIECHDFNQLFENQDLIRAQFGNTIKVSLQLQGGRVMRNVAEDLTKCQV